MTAVAKQLAAAIELLLERMDHPPRANCSCHLSPPCGDCVDYGGLREAIDEANAALAAHGQAARCGTCNEEIQPDEMTGTTCKCAQAPADPMAAAMYGHDLHPEGYAPPTAQPSPGGQGDARVQFEAWAKVGLDRDEMGEYTSRITQMAWTAWKAALAARQPVGHGQPWQLQLADALDCAWNPAIQAEHDGGGPAAVLAHGLAAVAARLREHVAGEEMSPEVTDSARAEQRAVPEFWWVRGDDGGIGTISNAEHAAILANVPPEDRSGWRPCYASAAVDLEQFRGAVEYTLRRYEGAEGYPRGAARMRELLALIDAQKEARNG